MRKIVDEQCEATASGAEQAVVGVTVHDKEFVFCLHHFHQHAEALAKQGGEISAVHPDYNITVNHEPVAV